VSRKYKKKKKVELREMSVK